MDGWMNSFQWPLKMELSCTLMNALPNGSTKTRLKKSVNHLYRKHRNLHYSVCVCVCFPPAWTLHQQGFCICAEPKLQLGAVAHVSHSSYVRPRNTHGNERLFSCICMRDKQRFFVCFFFKRVPHSSHCHCHFLHTVVRNGAFCPLE